MIHNVQFNVRLKELRDRNNLTQRYVADYLGIDVSTYAHYEKGDRSPDVSKLSKLAELYNLTDEILGVYGSNITGFCETYAPLYFDDNGATTKERRLLGLSGARYTPVCRRIEAVVMDTMGTIDWKQFAWKAGRLKFLNQTSDRKNEIMWREDGFCWDGKNGRGALIEKDVLSQYICRIYRKYGNVLCVSEEKSDSLYVELLKMQGYTARGKLEDENLRVNNVGAVYILAIIFFLSNGVYPIYDKYAHKAVKALYSNRSPKEVFVGEAPDKSKIDDVIAMYEEYLYLLRSVFGTHSISREEDRALWIYGHCDKKWR